MRCVAPFTIAFAVLSACSDGTKGDGQVENASVVPLGTPSSSEAKVTLGSEIELVDKFEVITEPDIFRDDFQSVEEAGGMVLKIDPEELSVDGFMAVPNGDSLTVFYDPSCADCTDITMFIDIPDVDIIPAPVAFYSEDGLTVVGDKICEERGFSDPSEPCDQLVSGMRANTKFLMLAGIVDLPAVLLPNGWLHENITSKDQVHSMLKGGS